MKDEDADHIIISACDFARQFWARIGWRTEDIRCVEDIWNTKPPEGTPKKAASTLDPPLLLGIVETPT